MALVIALTGTAGWRTAGNMRKYYFALQADGRLYADVRADDLGVFLAQASDYQLCEPDIVAPPLAFVEPGTGLATLAASGVFTSSPVDLGPQFARYNTACFTKWGVVSTGEILVIEESTTGSGGWHTLAGLMDYTGAKAESGQVGRVGSVSARYLRAVFTNGATPQMGAFGRWKVN